MKNQGMRRHFSLATDNGDTTGPEEKISAVKRKISAEEFLIISDFLKTAIAGGDGSQDIRSARKAYFRKSSK